MARFPCAYLVSWWWVRSVAFACTRLYQVRKWTRELLHGYIQHPAVTTDEVDNYIIPSSFGQQAGMVGCLTLAHLAYEESGKRGAGAGPVTATRTLTTTTSCAASDACCKGGVRKIATYTALAALVAGAVMVVAKASKTK